MDRSSRETPMEFVYDNGKGPVDESSPFVRYAQQPRLGNKRTYSAFESSPTKNAQNSFPSLRPAHNEKVFFSDMPMEIDPVTKPLPPTPSIGRMKNLSLFSTPRKMDVDASSGAETPETPGHNADSEATPDGHTSPYKFHGTEGRSKSPRKKRESVFSKLWRGSPGKGGHGSATEATSMVVSRTYSKNGEKRVVKRRAKVAAEASTRKRRERTQQSQPEDGSDVEEIDSKTFNKTTKASSQEKVSLFSLHSFLTYLESHPTLPHILSFYAQLALNVFLIFGLMYILYSFWSTIVSDVDDKAREATAEILAEMAVCAKHYRENNCQDLSSAPALRNLCAEWEKCTGRDPKSVGRARVGARTFAEIFNGFVEPISYKAMIFSILFTFGLITLCNVAFGLLRRQQANDPYMQYAPVPPTPHRQPSGGYYGLPPSTPYGNHHQGLMGAGSQMGLEPAPSGVADGMGMGSPSKMLEFR